MQIMALGLRHSTRQSLIDPVGAAAVADAAIESLARRPAKIREFTALTTRSAAFRTVREVMRKEVDFSDPRAAGWTFLLAANDPLRESIIEVMRPLAEHRGMKAPGKPLLYRGGEEAWEQWLYDDFFSPNFDQPHYVLIVGGPEWVPFRFQALLATVASVGRVAFDSLIDLCSYIEKLIRLDVSLSPAADREALFFAPVYPSGPHGLDPTYFSHRYMARPLAELVRTELGFATFELMEQQATKSRLTATLRTRRPALVYTASHGLGAPDETLEVQKRVNGSICCQMTTGATHDEDWLFTADDVPLGEPFLEGALFFQFACYGYGTPSESEYAHWFGKTELNGSADFVSALPKRLLAHPRGPIAYIGHLDVAWLHGFDDPEQPGLADRWNTRIEPFKRAIELLLRVEPAGRAMADMNARYNFMNALITNAYDRIQRGRVLPEAEFKEALVSQFITRSDAQNYMIYGDPAAHLRIPGSMP